MKAMVRDKVGKETLEMWAVDAEEAVKHDPKRYIILTAPYGTRPDEMDEDEPKLRIRGEAGKRPDGVPPVEEHPTISDADRPAVSSGQPLVTPAATVVVSEPSHAAVRGRPAKHV